MNTVQGTWFCWSFTWFQLWRKHQSHLGHISFGHGESQECPDTSSTSCWTLRMGQCASRAGELRTLELGLGVERSRCWNYFGLVSLSFFPLIIIISETENKENGEFFLLWTQSFWPKLLPSLGHLLAASTEDAEAWCENGRVTLTLWVMGANAGTQTGSSALSRCSS